MEYCGLPDRTGTNCTWRWRISTTRGSRPRVPRRTGSRERFHKTVLNEFYRVSCQKKLYTTLEKLQAYPDAWLREYNDLSLEPPLHRREIVPPPNAPHPSRRDRRAMIISSGGFRKMMLMATGPITATVPEAWCPRWQQQPVRRSPRQYRCHPWRHCDTGFR
jgi:hypothetical protein